MIFENILIHYNVYGYQSRKDDILNNNIIILLQSDL